MRFIIVFVPVVIFCFIMGGVAMELRDTFSTVIGAQLAAIEAATTPPR